MLQAFLQTIQVWHWFHHAWWTTGRVDIACTFWYIIWAIACLTRRYRERRQASARFLFWRKDKKLIIYYLLASLLFLLLAWDGGEWQGLLVLGDILAIMPSFYRRSR